MNSSDSVLPSKYMMSRIDFVVLCNVSGMFAVFCNVDNRGPNFTWERFIDNCVDNVEQYLARHQIKTTPSNLEYGKMIARSFATNLVSAMNT